MIAPAISRPRDCVGILRRVFQVQPVSTLSSPEAVAPGTPAGQRVSVWSDFEPANGTTKPAIAEGTRPGPKRAFDRY